MKKRKLHLFVRRSHRYLALVFGIQFLFWTAGGFYFSWTNIKHIRGDDIRRETPFLNIDSSFIPPSAAIRMVKQTDTVQYIKSVQLVNVLDSVYYQVIFFNGKRLKSSLVNTVSGYMKQPLNQLEAMAVAKASLIMPVEPSKIEYLTQASGHHEYRDNPLPAYAIYFEGGLNTTIYVSAEEGTVQNFRNTEWRVFDFFWMLHTMDYQGRDNINNWVLRIFTILGLVTLFSGFALFAVSFRKNNKEKPIRK